MPLVTLKEILPAARRAGRAVAAFNIANFETAQAVIAAAEAENQPVVLQVYHRLMAHPQIGALTAMMRRMAEDSTVPIVVHLDHGTSLDQVQLALRLGFSSVMFDGSALPLAENIAQTLQAAKFAAAAGASLEAEIGPVPLNEHAAAPLPTAKEVTEFVAATGVDALAVAVGTVHGYYRQNPNIDLDLGRQAGAAVTVPLVLHGGSGTPWESVAALIRCGFAKVNVATEFQHAFQRCLGQELERLHDDFLPLDKLMQPVVAAAVDFLRERIRRFADPSHDHRH